MMTNSTQDKPSNSLSDDILHGAAAISDFIGSSKRKTLYKLEKGQIPAGKDGRGWVGSKRLIREHYNRITSGAAT